MNYILMTLILFSVLNKLSLLKVITIAQRFKLSICESLRLPNESGQVLRETLSIHT